MLIILHRPSDCYAYRLAKREPITADLLADFLTDDVGNRAQDYISDFEDDKCHAAAMNATQYSKDDGIVTITPEWVIDEDESIAKGHFFRINAKILTSLLRQWKEVYIQQPTYIIIKIESDIPTVVGADELSDILE